MQRESGEGQSQDRLKEIIDGSMQDLGLHRDAIEECGGDAKKAAELNLERISRVVQVAYGEIIELEEAPQNPEASVSEAENTIAA